MGTIKIGSAKNKKGISINPSIVLFDNKNVEKIVSGSTTIWENINPLVPIMTSNTTPSGIVIFTSENASAGYSAYKVFDGSDSSMWALATSEVSGYIGYIFTKSVCVKKIEVKAMIHSDGNSAVKNFRVEGSNDGSNWNQVYSGVLPNNANKNSVSFNNDGYYLYYRIYVVDSYVTIPSYLALYTLQFYGK